MITVLESLRQAGHLESWRVFRDKVLIALDGTLVFLITKDPLPQLFLPGT